MAVNLLSFNSHEIDCNRLVAPQMHAKSASGLILYPQTRIGVVLEPIRKSSQDSLVTVMHELCWIDDKSI
jgi:hypothetical protein